MERQTSHEYEVVVTNVEQDTQRALLDIVRGARANGHCDVIEIEAELSGPTIVARGEKPALDQLALQLRTAGIDSLVVRSPQKSTPPPQPTELHQFFQKYTASFARVLQNIDVAQVEKLVQSLVTARREGRQIFFLGNGGSAAAASHMMTDFAKVRFDDDKLLFRVMSLTDNTAYITATGNDFGYDNVFVNQLRNLLRPQDVVIAISSSGNSANVLRAVEYANGKGAETFGIVGFDGGKLLRLAHNPVFIPTRKGQYGYMEDATMVIGHIMSIYIYEQDLATVAARGGR